MISFLRHSLRSNVLRVVGTRLPIELADLIIEFAIKAEDFPADPMDRGMGFAACERDRERVEPSTSPG